MDSQSTIIKNFESLSDFEKTIFSVMYIYYLPIHVFNYSDLFEKLKIYNPETQKKLSEKEIKELCILFFTKKLISWESGKTVQIDISVDKSLFDNHFIQKVYEGFGGRIAYKRQQKIEELGEYRMRNHEHKEKLILSSFRFIFQNNELSQKEKKEECTLFHNTYFVMNVSPYSSESLFTTEDEGLLWKNLYEVIPFETLLSVIPVSKRQKVFTIVKGTMLYGEKSNEEIQVLTKKYPKDLLEILLFQGEFSHIEKIVKTLKPNAYSLDIQGMCYAFQGKTTEAKRAFGTSLLLFKKEFGKRVNFSSYMGGVFYVLLLLQEGFDVNNKSSFVYKWIRSGIKANNLYSPLYEKLEDLFFFEQGDSVETHSYFNFSQKTPSHCIDFLVSSILEHRIFKNSFENSYGQWEAEGKKWNKKGFEFVLSQVVSLRCNDVNSPFRFQKKIAEPWEKTLSFLKDITKTNEGIVKKTVHNSRIAWQIECEYSRVQITPKLQKQNKDGSWSKGRNIALKTLFNGGVSEDIITPQDAKVIKTISSYSSYNYYGGTEYEIQTPSAMAVLVGHPSAIARDGKLVTIEISSPELVIKKTKKGISLSFSEEISDEQGFCLTKVSNHWYKIMEITVDHILISEKLEQNKILPLAAEPELQKVLGGLSKVISLQSDIVGDSATIETVEASTVLQIHLKRVDDGFMAECFMEPIENSEKFFHPGKGQENILLEKDGKDLQTQRNLIQEKKEYNTLVSGSIVLQEQESQPFIFHSASIFNALELLEELKKIHEKNPETIKILWPEGESLKLNNSIESKNISISIKKSGQNWFKLSGEISSDGDTNQKIMEMKELLEKVKNTDSRFLEMGNNEFWSLSEDLFMQLKKIEGVSEDGKFHALTSSFIEESLEGFPMGNSDSFWKKQKKQWDASYTKKYPFPVTLQAELREYQKEGFEWMSRLSDLGMGACLADDMGLGKTIQSIALLLSRAKKGASFVVAPVSVIPNWKSEIAKFSPTLNVIVLTGTPENRKELLNNLKPFDIVLCSYGTLSPDQEILEKIQWNTIILDEAQAIKNHTTKRSKAVFSLQADARIVTTGTPMENHLGELWSLFRFLNPGFLGDFKKFSENFLSPIDKDANAPQKKHLKNLINPFLLRRKKSEVLTELPEKTEVNLYLDLSEKEKIFYEALRSKAVENIEANKEENSGTQHLKVLAEIMKLRQGCCHSSLVDKSLDIESCKLEKLAEVLQELQENGHKVLIFSQFVGYLKIIKTFLETKKISYRYIDGSTPMKKREDEVVRFQNGEADAFLISLKAGGSGLNLTAANYVIHMDPWWNPAVEDQASDRAHRIGQKQKVTIYRFITKDTIEEKIIAMHKTKRDLADSLLEGAGKISKISTNELIDLLKKK